jgi:protein O-GlcNAc transferase
MTTTCDFLWMGLPIVTLSGTTPQSRAGASLLRAVGLAELVAESAAEYVSTAAALSRDLPRLALWRHDLRRRMEVSSLRDELRVARQLEAAYRHMWRQWCAANRT